MIAVTILGSTGSVGRQTLEVLARHPGHYRVQGLSAHTDAEQLYQQCLRWRPRYAVLADATAAARLRRRLQGPQSPEILHGEEGLQALAADPGADYVMLAIVGAAGLFPALHAVRGGKRILLANKEVLVMAGQFFMDAVRDHRAELVPIDSEHNALFQCLCAGAADDSVRRVLLTASGGPFRCTASEQLERVTPAQALRHPNWQMGKKISIDSATMMNKGLEVIEACWLFGLKLEQVEVIVHPQSVVHALVEYTDGSMLAQLGSPDMRIPIAHALAWPRDRIESGARPLDLTEVGRLDFQPPDPVRFPCLRLAREAMRTGGTATAVLNAANEVAVAGFLQNRLRFARIAAVIEEVLNRMDIVAADSLELICQADRGARELATRQVKRHAA